MWNRFQPVDPDPRKRRVSRHDNRCPSHRHDVEDRNTKSFQGGQTCIDSGIPSGFGSSIYDLSFIDVDKIFPFSNTLGQLVY